MNGWWERDDLQYADERLIFAGRSVEGLAGQFGSPSFFYSAGRVSENIGRLHAALDDAGFSDRHRVNYAMKANRFAPLLTYLKTSGLCTIDACSPQEVEHAISCGFRPQEISFTATSLSDRDFDRLSRLDGLIMNCDSLHAIRQWGERGAGRSIGIRINPAVGIGRAQNEMLQYSGGRTTKFGIYREQFDEAVALAGRFGLTIERIHFHTGCGYLTSQLQVWEKVIEECLWFIDQLDTVKTVNVGGGLGVPHTAQDEALDLEQWAAILQRHFLPRNLRVEVEPGDYLVKDAGLLLLTVNAVEKKKDTVFAGVDAGFNLAVEPAVYGLPFQPVPVRRRPGGEERVTVVGNINEALDVWYTDLLLTPLASADHLALINAGAYSSSMSSNHCMRGEFREFLLL
jgi:diaminopimelate decarboxylase